LSVLQKQRVKLILLKMCVISQHHAWQQKVFKKATLAFDVIQQQEVTKQLEHGTRQAAYEMQTRQYEISRVKDEGDEARQTLMVFISVD